MTDKTVTIERCEPREQVQSLASLCTLKTAYKYDDKKYQDIRGNCYNNNQLNRFEKTNRKNKPITNACNAIHVCLNSFPWI